MWLAAFAAASALLFAAPAAHAATTSISSVAITGTITFDGADDAVTITNVGGALSHGLNTSGSCPSCNSDVDWSTLLPGDQPLAASPLTLIEVNGGEGADTLTAPRGALELLKATLNGEGGNDLLTGSQAADDLRGGPGNDRLVGFVGNDDMEGGDGNDTLAWSNGDNSDTMDGDAGNDGVEVNGAPTASDVFTIQPGPVSGRTRFDRTNLVAFNLDILAERLEVNGLGGDDTIAAEGALSSQILLRLDGGTGADAITGADGRDLIVGDEEGDNLSGGAGDDRIAGDRGNDTVNGDAGDDTLAWNDGDASDVLNGGDGRDLVEVNGSPTAGDVFALQPNGARVKLDRTNLIPFSLDIGTSEAMALHSLAGDDAVGIGEVGAFGVVADGGSGNDLLTGAGGAESFFGGTGNDAIVPGPGVDFASGDEGDDFIGIRDVTVDVARCGAGNDQVIADVVLLDVVAEDCETSNRPFAGGDIVTQPIAISPATVKIKKGKGKLLIACPATSVFNCQGVLTVVSRKPVKIGKVRTMIQLARAAFDTPPGKARRLSIKVPKGAETLADRKGRIQARALATTGVSPARASTSQKLTLDFGRPKARREGRGDRGRPGRLR
jgi:Ca2+-binding RTX toxin-like protein